MLGLRILDVPIVDLWAKAKAINGTSEYKVWLVWLIGEYKNHLPSVELRAIYTNRERAIGVAKGIQKHEQGISILGTMPLITYTEVLVEPRTLNHHYGGEAMEFKIHREKYHE